LIVRRCQPRKEPDHRTCDLGGPASQLGRQEVRDHLDSLGLAQLGNPVPLVRDLDQGRGAPARDTDTEAGQLRDLGVRSPLEKESNSNVRPRTGRKPAKAFYGDGDP
jgi:hypothetical protein